MVPRISLNNLLDDECIEKFSLVAMDIEGNDPMALVGFDIERLQS